jgi:DNA-binding MarR family transcriptional regulator
MDSTITFILQLAKFQAITSRKIDGGLSVHGLGLNDFMVLYYLTHAPEGKLRRVDLAEKMGVTASGVTRMLAPMEKIGLVTREANKHDARISYVVLAPGGKRLFKESLKTMGYVAKELFPITKTKKIEQLTDLFTEIAGGV